MPFQLQDGTGSVHLAKVDNSGALNVVGSVNTSVTTGSQSFNFIQSGNGAWIEEPEYRNVVLSGTPTVSASITGSIHIGSVSANVDSIYIQSGANILGSVGVTNIDSPQTIGSHGGVVPVSGEFDNITGSVNIDNFGDLGSSRVITDILGTVSTNNSTTTNLAANGSYVGTFEEIKDYSTIGFAIRTDNDSATDGFKVEFATDNDTGSIIRTNSFTISSGINGAYFNKPVEARYYRTVYENGAGGGSLWLQTLLHPTTTKESTLRLSEDVDGETAASLVRAVIAGEQPTGDFTNVQTTAGGNLKVSLEEWVDSVGSFNLLGIGSVRIAEQGVDLTTDVNNPATIGSFTAAKNVLLGSTSLHGVGSVVNLGSVEVYQTTNSDLQVQATQEGTWDINNLSMGSVRIVSQADTERQITAGSVRIVGGQTGSVHNIGSIGVYGQNTLGSVHNIGSIGVYGQNTLGSVHNIGSIGVYGGDVDVLLGSTNIYNRVAGSIVNLPGVDINDPETIGSYTTQTINGSVAITSTNLGSVHITGDASVTGSVRIFGVSGTDDYPLAVRSGTGFGILRVDLDNQPNVLLGSTSVYNDVQTLLGSTSLHGVGSIVNLGSVEVFQTVGTDLIMAGSVRQFENFDVLLGSTALHGVGSVVNLGSVEVFQTTNSDLQVQATQEGTWNINNLTSISDPIPNDTSSRPDQSIGSVTVIGGRRNGNAVPLLTSADSGLHTYITHHPSVVKISGAITNIGSVMVVGARAGGDNGSVLPLRLDPSTGSHLLIAGSINSLPDIVLPAGSVRVVYQAGSIEVFQADSSDLVITQASTLRQITAGSIRLLSTPGSIATYPDAGSNAIYYDSVGSVVISGTSTVVVDNYPSIQKSSVTHGSHWTNNSGGLLSAGPRSGLILQNLGPGDVHFNFGSPFTGSEYGFRLFEGDVYEMPDYFLYTGSITLAKIGTGSANIGYMEI